MTRPLPEDVARTARAYLGALVPPGEVSDAWHELVADATYWGDRDLVSIMVMAHQVVLQHQRVAPEVAVLALQELDLDQPDTLARVLAVDAATADRLTDEVAASVEGGPAADPVGRFATATASDRPRAAVSAPARDVPSEPAPDLAPQPAPAAIGPSGDALRIGFEDDERPITGFDDLGPPGGVTGRRVALAVAVVVVVVVALVLLLTP